jgi:hypothetical protein
MPTRQNAMIGATAAAEDPPTPAESSPARTSALAQFVAAGFDTRRGRSWLTAITFFEREGHLQVPAGHQELGMHLYQALVAVRARYRANRLTSVQVAAWESIGMTWPETLTANDTELLPPKVIIPEPVHRTLA